ncbi:MAG: HAMP domain-containing sensor histidine kinase [Bacteroidia bacterium]|nr:HAMP domain-containing histidine kinase [Bacteroidia bacterium]MDW8014630.1 HAMP domain-containing sensor histidine kinase [Bacteroidia bacterium]
MRLRWLVLIISVLLLFLVAVSFYAQALARRLLEQQVTLVHLYAAGLRYAAQAPEDCLNSFFWDYIFPESRKGSRLFLVPLILVNEEGKVISHNLQELRPLLPKGEKVLEYLPYLRADTVKFPPIEVSYGGERRLKIYYGEPLILRHVRWMPVIASGIIVIAGLIWIGFLYTAHRYRQDKLWVGLARETAHQLGTPLSGLLGSIEILKESPQLLDRLLPRMEEDLERLNEIADRFSKIGMEPRLRRQPLSPIVEETVRYFEQRLPRSIRLVYRPPEHEVILPLNATLLRWAIENLLRNSQDALPAEGGTISVSVKVQKGEVCIDVADTGRGISPTHWEEVFRPGFSTKSRGWGMGLALTRRVIEEYHGGEIFVARSSPKEGTVMRIRLPLLHRLSLPRRLWRAFLRRFKGFWRLLCRSWQQIEKIPSSQKVFRSKVVS